MIAVFDLDDTLFRERDFCRSGFKFLCDPMQYGVMEGEPYPDSATLQQLQHQMVEEIVARRNPFAPFEALFKSLSTDPDNFDIQRHIAAYRAHMPTISLADGVERTLSQLKASGIRMAVITDGRSLTQRNKFRALGLDKYIEDQNIIISEETGYDKNSSRPFELLMERMSEEDDFAYIGDNVAKDFFHPNQLGWLTIMVPAHPDNVHPRIAPPSPLHKPQIELDSFESLLEYL